MSADTGTGPEHHRSGRAAPGSETTRNRTARIAAIAPVLLAAAAALAAAAHIGADEVPGLAAPDAATRLIAPPVRALLDLAAVATVGLSLLPRLLPDRGRHARRHLALSRRTAVITALTWLICALLLLVLYAAELVGGTPTAEDVAGYVSGVPAGTALALSAVCAAGCAALGLTGVVRDGRTTTGGSANEGPTDDLRAVLALLGLLPMPLTGHATDWEYHNLSMVSVQLHVLAAAVWAGGLAAITLFVAPHRGPLATTLPRYSRLATAAITVVAVTGLFNGLTELTATGIGLDGLVTTGYGRIVLLKTALLALLAGLGGHARYRLLPRIERHQRTALITWATAELAVMGLAYGLGAVLARAPVLT
ncbi:CopD family protein [Saccharopolyspora sp. NFXS83]|uniref:copper resistance D family protein n=1 Tax=Saccharopolyspora sp. NFXS83 TaxID=2993560 RepID=UPI00224B0956|nr:CopD family protein [Saccharopolyspora sp. NFXS83]MCX2729056.1 CopD family protein [Saccharopolyspora sp. NFXS83]